MRDYKKEWGRQQERGAYELKNRAARARARRLYDRLGIERDGKDIDHKVKLSKGGSDGKSNLRLVEPSTNRSFERNSDRSAKD